ncbi:MAG TPA: DUF4124 domain-containing protein [Thiolinea sp.]|nr:DUF4124 domain-containing protein [Thiolinea sp.]
MNKHYLVLFLAVLLGLFAPLQAEVYRWTDASGRVYFGDKPPENSRATNVDLPPLTVADSFFKHHKPEDGQEQEATAPETPDKADAGQDYRYFEVLFPKNEDTVRTNGGQVTVQLEIDPPLQPGHGLVFYMDGKQMGKSSSTSLMLENVDRGNHSVFAVLHDASGEVIRNTQPVRFNVLRASILR